jgi:hypothetical protein
MLFREKVNSTSNVETAALQVGFNTHTKTSTSRGVAKTQ